MRLALASDEHTPLTDFLASYLRQQGHTVQLFGPPAGTDEEWAIVSQHLAEAVAQGPCEQGVLCCWTGTGSCIAANKVPGIRAALCTDAETARGARQWNHANVLVLSLRLTTEALAQEILAAWFATPYGTEPFDVRNIEHLKAIEASYSKPQDI